MTEKVLSPKPIDDEMATTPNSAERAPADKRPDLPKHRSKTNHPNNSEAIESKIQAFLSAKTTYQAVGSAKTQEMTFRDKIRILLQQFAPPGESSLSARGDVLDLFAEATPYASSDRHRRYPSEVSSSQHPDIQNSFLLEQRLEKAQIQTKATLTMSRLVRMPIHPSVLFTELRNNQNKAWAESSIQQGNDLLKNNDVEKALKMYNHAFEIDDKCANAMIAIGTLYSNKGMWDKSIAAFEKALELEPLNENAFLLLERTVDKSGKKDYRKSKFYLSITARRRFNGDDHDAHERQVGSDFDRLKAKDSVTPFRSSTNDFSGSRGRKRSRSRDRLSQSSRSPRERDRDGDRSRPDGDYGGNYSDKDRGDGEWGRDASRGFSRGQYNDPPRAVYRRSPEYDRDRLDSRGGHYRSPDRRGSRSRDRYNSGGGRRGNDFGERDRDYRPRNSLSRPAARIYRRAETSDDETEKSKDKDSKRESAAPKPNDGEISYE